MSRAPLRSGPAQRHTPSDSSDRRTLSHTRAYARKSVHRSPALADRVRRNARPPAAGPEYACQSETDFCQASGCPPEHLENWLKEEWVQHNLHRVESGEEQPGRFPLVLFRQQVGAFYEVRLY